jgi:hypothetical protein
MRPSSSPRGFAPSSSSRARVAASSSAFSERALPAWGGGCRGGSTHGGTGGADGGVAAAGTGPAFYFPFLVFLISFWGWVTSNPSLKIHL